MPTDGTIAAAEKGLRHVPSDEFGAPVMPGAAFLEPGVVISALAREAGIHPSQLYCWRRKLCARRGGAPDFASVRIVGEPAAAGLPAPLGVIEIELVGGTRLRITGAADAATVSA